MKSEWIMKYETNVDHLTGEELGNALLKLAAMPAVLDASYFSGIGKKNRPCGKLEILCHLLDADEVALAVFRHTHSLGLRRQKIERLVLDRKEAVLEDEQGSLPVKTYRLEEGDYMRPEADALAKRAEENGVGMPALRFQAAK